MLKVTIGIIPFGNSVKARTISTIKIVNNNSGNDKYGNYDVYINGVSVLKIKKHERSKGALFLLYEVLRKHFEKNQIEKVNGEIETEIEMD